MKGRRESHRNTESIAAIGQEDSDIEKLIRLDEGLLRIIFYKPLEPADRVT
jgi:hypothetical protein